MCIAGSAAMSNFPRNVRPFMFAASASRIAGTPVTGFRKLNLCSSIARAHLERAHVSTAALIRPLLFRRRMVRL